MPMAAATPKHLPVYSFLFSIRRLTMTPIG